MTTTTNLGSADAAIAPVPPPAPASGAKDGEWRDIPHHSADIAPLAAKRRWRERGLLAALLTATAVLYLWQLGASGYANDFYAAAVQAGTKSWKALFFGSFDSSNFITVDKPPASLWPMELSGRIFGFNSWSMLAPQAVEGVLSVWLLYAAVRRWFGATAGLLAGLLLAITPVAVLMFRFNNPDALMTLLIVAAAYCVTRAIEVASTRWLLLAGAAVGFSFLAKGLQPFTVLPALALAYLIAAPTSLRRRIWQLLAAGGALVAGAGWWVLAVQLTPVADRPYIGGSGDNTALGLAFGYNGLGRITGDETGTGGGGGGANFSGSTGIGRLFNSLNGGQIAWLLPAALIGLVGLVVLTRHRARTDRVRAAAIVWGGWLLVTGAVLSYASGIIHTYYTIELAPAIAALVAVGTVQLWRHRAQLAARIGLAVGAVVTGWWSLTLLHRSAGWHPWVAGLVIAAGLVAAVAVLAATGRAAKLAIVAAMAGIVSLTGGSVAYALDTAATPQTGSIPSAGPTVSSGSGFGGPGGGGFGGGRGGAGRTSGAGTLPGRGSGGFGGPPGSTGTGSTGNGSTGTGSTGTGSTGTGSTGAGSTGTGSTGTGSRPGQGTGQGGGLGGGQTTTSTALTALLKATTTKWAAATVGSQSAAPLELASGKAVIAIGGFSGTDDAPTLAQFEALVAKGEVRYFIAGGGGGGGAGPGGNGGSSSITTWVEAHFSSTTVGGTTVYDLTKASTS